MNNNFYVYEHWRPDLDLCFYVGKGHGRRAYDLTRNLYHKTVLRELGHLGLCAEVRLVRGELDETTAFALEIERIAFWREAGVVLTNLTDGGDGPAHSEATKRKIAAKAVGRKASEETRALFRRQRKNRRWSLETKAKMSASARIAQKLRFESELSTPEGREAMKIKMTAMAKLGSSEVRRKAALIGWEKRKAKDVVS